MKSESTIWKGFAARRRIVVLGAVGVCLGVWGCQPRNEFVPPPPPTVTVATPLQREVQTYFETTGRTAASAEVELRARVSGYLQDIRFQDGALVEANAELFLIDRAPYEAAMALAQADLERAEAQQVLADRELTRTRNLVAREAATQSKLDEEEARLASAKADVAAAQAALREAQLNLDYTVIRAPFAGRISEALLDAGNLVQPGTSLLARLQAVSPVYAYFTLSETDLLNFMRMQQAGEIKISDADPIEIELALGETGQFAFKGRLDYREFGIDPGTGTTRRRATFDNTELRLIPGLFVRLRARVGEPKSRLLVSERAIAADQRGEYLLVVNAKNVVELRTVRLGQREGDLRVIESGLNPNDRVVINGLQRARPGVEVNPQAATMTALTDTTNAVVKPSPTNEADARQQPTQNEPTREVEQSSHPAATEAQAASHDPIPNVGATVPPATSLRLRTSPASSSVADPGRSPNSPDRSE